MFSNFYAQRCEKVPAYKKASTIANDTIDPADSTYGQKTDRQQGQGRYVGRL